jgi:hypothetical protein
MNGRTDITITLPVSMLGAFRVATARHGISIEAACKRIICGLSGLTNCDLKTLPEPSHERRNQELRVSLEWRYVDRLSAATRVSNMTISSIFRRILHALLFTRKVHFISRNGNEISLELTQMHFEFADDYESDGPIPLLSRQHRDAHDTF